LPFYDLVVSDELPPVLHRMLKLWNGGDGDPADVYARECLTNGGPETFHPEEVLPVIANYRTAFPDLRWEVENWFSASDRYVLRMKASGNHTGGAFASEIGTALPTGRPIAFHGIEVFEVRDDRIIDVWLGWDFGQLYAAVGARI